MTLRPPVSVRESSSESLLGSVEQNSKRQIRSLEIETILFENVF